MKKLFISVSVIVLILIGFAIYINNSISNNDVYKYKAYISCENIVKNILDNPNSFNVTKKSVYLSELNENDIDISITAVLKISTKNGSKNLFSWCSFGVNYDHNEFVFLKLSMDKDFYTKLPYNEREYLKFDSIGFKDRVSSFFFDDGSESK